MKRLSQPIGLHVTPRLNARFFDLASDELAISVTSCPSSRLRWGNTISSYRRRWHPTCRRAIGSSSSRSPQFVAECRRGHAGGLAGAAQDGRPRDADHRDDGPWAIVSIENAGFGEAEAPRLAEA